MDIWRIDRLLLFLIFFIPGFISVKVYGLLVPSERTDFSKSLFETIGYSALNFAALSWLIILIHSADFYLQHPLWYFTFLLLIMFLAPILWPILFLRLCSWSPLAKHVTHPIPKPWDYVFGKREPFWIILHLKDGRKVGGRFDGNSFASSYPAEEQIYLEELWELDDKGRFIKPIERSKGIIISGSQLSSVEFFQ